MLYRLRHFWLIWFTWSKLSALYTLKIGVKRNIYAIQYALALVFDIVMLRGFSGRGHNDIIAFLMLNFCVRVEKERRTVCNHCSTIVYFKIFCLSFISSLLTYVGSSWAISSMNEHCR